MPSNWVETSVDVSYGQIACKVWGSKCDDSVNIVALHGFMDNCGSFDQLIPLLDNDYFVVAVDFPGHGFSSHLPAGIAYTDSTWILAVEAVIAHFEFEKIIFISHSMGSTVAFYYATLFPERVTKIIAFDTLMATIHPMENIPKEMAKGYKYLSDLQKKKANITPTFDPKMAVRLLIAAHKTFGDLDEESAKILLLRSTKLTDDKQRIVFTRDERLNCTLSMLPFKSNFEILKEY
ncbi:serine hydrolase-like protein [Leptotrombidium deliense]|uniref:Serine hydrolase-like protein n=1 Tax=Leptotrombidium deliense TaxID=299467 RepID=A0A443SDL4_9ACAR|nr:serine hydrolase-like protein [Leptotrombidium deliense]